MNLKLIIADAFHFYRTHLVQIASLCLPWLLIAALVEYLIASAGDPTQGLGPLHLLAWSFNLLVYPIYTAALILLMSRRAQQEQPQNSEILAAAIKIWQPFFFVHVIGAGLTLMGLLVFILPGIYIAVRLSFAEFYIVLEDIKPVEAIQKSIRATRPHILQIFLLLVLFVTPFLMLSMLLSSYMASMEITPILNIISAAVTAFLMLFVDVVLFRYFMSVRQESQA